MDSPAPVLHGAVAPPWLTLVGIGEDGPAGLSEASRDALRAAEVVAGARRHLDLLGPLTAQVLEWPVPFADGVDRVLALRGRRVVVLASGDPFWFGAGAVFAARLGGGEWVAHPGVSVFGWAAARLGWRLEEVTCAGLHAAPFARLRPALAPGVRAIATLRDGAAVVPFAQWLTGLGFGETRFWVMEAVGGPRERISPVTAAEPGGGYGAPVAVALEVAGPGLAMPCCAGLPDALFGHDGQITKRPVRALTLSALAPRAGELLWDIGAGSGSVGIEWLLAHPRMRAIAVEAEPARADQVRRNAAALGAERLTVIVGRAPDVLAGLPPPDAVFIGGGLSDALLGWLWAHLAPGTRMVANAVTLESEALLALWQARAGGSLLRIDLAESAPLGRRRGWRAALPVVQWSAVV